MPKRDNITIKERTKFVFEFQETLNKVLTQPTYNNKKDSKKSLFKTFDDGFMSFVKKTRMSEERAARFFIRLILNYLTMVAFTTNCPQLLDVVFSLYTNIVSKINRIDGKDGVTESEISSNVSDVSSNVSKKNKKKNRFSSRIKKFFFN